MPPGPQRRADQVFFVVFWEYSSLHELIHTIKPTQVGVIQDVTCYGGSEDFTMLPFCIRSLGDAAGRFEMDIS